MNINWKDINWRDVITRILISAALVAWGFYRGKKDCENEHKIILSKKTENIENHAKVKDTIRTESDDAVIRRALDNYERSKRERTGGPAKGL